MSSRILNTSIVSSGTMSIDNPSKTDIVKACGGEARPRSLGWGGMNERAPSGQADDGVVVEELRVADVPARDSPPSVFKNATIRLLRGMRDALPVHVDGDALGPAHNVDGRGRLRAVPRVLRPDMTFVGVARWAHALGPPRDLFLLWRPIESIGAIATAGSSFSLRWPRSSSHRSPASPRRARSPTPRTRSRSAPP